MLRERKKNPTQVSAQHRAAGLGLAGWYRRMQPAPDLVVARTHSRSQALLADRLLHLRSLPSRGILADACEQLTCIQVSAVRMQQSPAVRLNFTGEFTVKANK